MDIVTLAAARKSGGSGGDVTKQYVDEHLALKVDKVEGKGLSANDYTNADKTKVSNSPISSTASGTSFALTDAADAPLAGLMIEGRTTSSAGTITNIGDNGLSVTACGKNLVQSYTINNTTTTTYAPLITAKCIFKPDTDYVITFNANGAYYCYISEYLFTQSSYITTTTGRNAISVHTLSSLPAMPANGYDVIKRRAEYTASIENVMIEEGTTATPYEPYKGSTAALSTGLPLCSAGNVKDTADFGKGIVTKRTKIENGEIVALDTPTELSMTASELAAFHGLRTFENTTNITCTDSPQMTVDYLIDTDNGKAIGHLITTFSEMVLFETDLDTGTQITLNATITLSQPFTNFDEIVIEWGYKSNNYYEVFSNSFRSAYFSQMKRYKENRSSTQVEINLNYFNGGVYTCFIPTADDKLYITAIGGSVSRYITKIIGRKYNAA